MTPKYFLNSTTIRGILVAVFPTIVLILRAFGLEITQEEQNTLIDAVVNIVASVGAIVGLVVAWKGRWKATQPLTGKKHPYGVK